MARGILVKTWHRSLLLSLFFIILLLGDCALAGEAGSVSCATPGCGFQESLTIGGGKQSPAVTGYCPKSRKFVRLKLKSWQDYRKPHYCPGGQEKMQPIYDGSQITQIPCPKCGNLTLQYKRKLMFD